MNLLLTGLVGIGKLVDSLFNGTPVAVDQFFCIENSAGFMSINTTIDQFRDGKLGTSP